jgi:hypothetical protein
VNFEVLPDDEDEAQQWIEDALKNGDITKEDIHIAKRRLSATIE